MIVGAADQNHYFRGVEELCIGGSLGKAPGYPRVSSAVSERGPPVEVVPIDSRAPEPGLH